MPQILPTIQGAPFSLQAFQSHQEATRIIPGKEEDVIGWARWMVGVFLLRVSNKEKARLPGVVEELESFILKTVHEHQLEEDFVEALRKEVPPEFLARTRAVFGV